jgi:hypothetical protein
MNKLKTSLGFISIALLVATVPQASAYFNYSRKGGANAEMNGISFEKYKNFSKDWRLVTVRFRQDTKEMRLTYANDIAWKAMQSLKPDYPDGAAFGKVGVQTDKDPAFPSSEVPVSNQRFQLMIRDKKKFAETQGWGYALFDQNGHLFDEDLKTKTMACAACHSVVPERQFVFSRPMAIDFRSQLFPIAPTSGAGGIEFKEKNVKEFGQLFAKSISDLNSGQKTIPLKVLSLEGAIRKNSFSGTLDEIVPLLIETVKKEGKAAALIMNEKSFTIVSPLTAAKDCEKKTANQVIIYFNGSRVRESAVCG